LETHKPPFEASGFPEEAEKPWMNHEALNPMIFIIPDVIDRHRLAAHHF
jgi:hypothetical protein